jgi:hypothetical protein
MRTLYSNLVGWLAALGHRHTRNAAPQSTLANPLLWKARSLTTLQALLDMPLAEKAARDHGVGAFDLAVRDLQDAVAELFAQDELGVGGDAYEDFVEFQLAGAGVADDVAGAQVIDEVAEHGAVEELG